MLSFDLAEDITEEKLQSLKMNSDDFYKTFNKSNDDESREYDCLKRTFEDSKSGINSKLIQLDDRFAMPSSDKIRKYELLKLRKMIYNYKEKHPDYSIFQLFAKTSYRSMNFENNKLNSEQTECFKELFQLTEIGLKHQIKSEFTNLEEFLNDVHDTQTDFIMKLNAAISMVKRVYSYKNGMYFTDDYCQNVNNAINNIAETAIHLKSKHNYTIFELFYQLLHAKQKNGASHSQKHVKEIIMEIIKKGIGSVSKEISIIFHKLNTSANISNLDDYIRCCSKSLAMVIFYNSNITIEKGINKLKNNADKISEYYYYIQKNELHNPDDTVNLQALVAMCRALFVTEENQKRPLLKLLFSDDGYYAGNEKNNRRSNISKDVEEFHNNNGHVRKTLCRIMLEITNLYIRMYDNSIDFFIKRLELEEKIDNVIETLLNYHDFMLLSNTLNECYWNLVVAILPDEFLQDLMGSILLKKTNIIYESNILRDILLSDYNKKRKDINELINNYIESSTLTYTK